MKTIKQWTALALCLALLCALLPQLSLTAHAAEYSGSCGAEGDNLTWVLDPETGVLTITGSGEMADYEMGEAPWSESCESITALVLPEGLTRVGTYAFCGCALTEVSIPASVSEFGMGVFKGCTGLTSVVLPDGMSSLNWYTFSDCTGLTSVTLPSGLQTIGCEAFRGCTGLTDISFPEALSDIGDYAFYGCTGLKSLVLPEGLTTLRSHAFADCTGLTSLSLPGSLSYLNNGAFAGCTGLTSLSLPENLTGIGKEAFRGCTGLTEISFPKSLKSMENGAFRECTGLTGLSVPTNVSLGAYAFADCTGLTSLSIPYSLAIIPESAFRGCIGLTSLDFPLGVYRIERSAFEGCKAVASVTLSTSVTNIGRFAFRDCPALTEVTIPDEVKVVDTKAFGYFYNDGGEEEKVDRFTIYGYTGSAAQNYANDNGFVFVPLSQTNPFEDVSESDFYYTPVMWALANSITDGTDATHFSPNQTVMRCDAMVFLYAAKGRPDYTATENPFKDVKKKHWYYHAVMWAVENEITSGTDATHFSPKQTCSRSEIIQFLYATMGKPGYHIENPYTDVKNKHWYKDAAIWAYENRLERGANGKFQAKTPCTRAYVVTYLYRFITGKGLA